MQTLFLEPLPSQVEELLERRRRWGADVFDEVWDGVHHAATPFATSGSIALVREGLRTALAPLARQAGMQLIGAFNIGEWNADYRVPHAGLHRELSWDMCAPTAALVIEIVSPGDESWEKLPFYAAHNVDEVLIVDPQERSVSWLALGDGKYHPVEHSGLIDVGTRELAEQIDWPPIDSA
jgi:Putative restriction endonuclease